jgi:hypothetical protein
VYCAMSNVNARRATVCKERGIYSKPVRAVKLPG